MKLQMQPDSGGDSSFNILQQPDQILAFIKHALDSAREQMKTTPKLPTRSQRRQDLTLEDLRIVTDEDEDIRDEDEDGDSDDEEGGLDSEEEMTSTALNLLLSVLEGDRFDQNRVGIEAKDLLHSKSRPFWSICTYSGRDFYHPRAPR